MTDELKPCPFCGSNEGVVFDSPEYVACVTCGFEGVAVQDFNRRPIEDELRARVAELEAALEWYADIKNYLRGAPGEYTPREFITPMWLCDVGERARKALKGGEE